MTGSWTVPLPPGKLSHMPLPAAHQAPVPARRLSFAHEGAAVSKVPFFEGPELRDLHRKI